MREYTLRPDGKPRFFGGPNENTIIIDREGYHEYCHVCKLIQLEYRIDGRQSPRSCHCSSTSLDQLTASLYQCLDQCQDVEAVKRMLMMFVSRREMQV